MAYMCQKKKQDKYPFRIKDNEKPEIKKSD